SERVKALPEGTRLERQSQVSGLGSNPSINDLDRARQHLHTLRFRLDEPVHDVVTEADLEERAQPFLHPSPSLTDDTANGRFEVKLSNDSGLAPLCPGTGRCLRSSRRRSATATSGVLLDPSTQRRLVF